MKLSCGHSTPSKWKALPQSRQKIETWNTCLTTKTWCPCNSRKQWGDQVSRLRTVPLPCYQKICLHFCSQIWIIFMVSLQNTWIILHLSLESLFLVKIVSGLSKKKKKTGHPWRDLLMKDPINASRQARIHSLSHKMMNTIIIRLEFAESEVKEAIYWKDVSKLRMNVLFHPSFYRSYSPNRNDLCGRCH